MQRMQSGYAEYAVRVCRVCSQGMQSMQLGYAAYAEVNKVTVECVILTFSSLLLLVCGLWACMSAKNSLRFALSWVLPSGQSVRLKWSWLLHM
jgi:hypothetical protein